MRISSRTDTYDEDMYKASSVLLHLIGAVFALFVIGTTLDTISILLNPEYWALQQVLK